MKKMLTTILGLILLFGMLTGCTEQQTPADENKTPTADFSYITTNTTVSFTNASSDPDEDTLTYLWDFGDGTTSTDQNPTHTYTADGIYTVTLTVTDTEGATDTTSQVVTVSSDQTSPSNNPPNANFNYTVDNATRTVTFYDLSGDEDDDNLTNLWDYGDNTTSNESNLTHTHTYEGNGTYTVTLTVSDGKDNDTWTENIEIGNVAPSIDFVAINETGLMLFLQDISTDSDGTIVLREWNFGDGTSDSTEDVYITHTYTEAGTYTISLTITDDDGATATMSKDVIIELS